MSWHLVRKVRCGGSVIVMGTGLCWAVVGLLWPVVCTRRASDGEWLVLVMAIEWGEGEGDWPNGWPRVVFYLACNGLWPDSLLLAGCGIKSSGSPFYISGRSWPAKNKKSLAKLLRLDTLLKTFPEKRFNNY
jgi:hypothetical protein